LAAIISATSNSAAINSAAIISDPQQSSPRPATSQRASPSTSLQKLAIAQTPLAPGGLKPKKDTDGQSEASVNRSHKQRELVSRL
jgi:hypothetical protein